VLFPGASLAVVVMAFAMEGGQARDRRLALPAIARDGPGLAPYPRCARRRPCHHQCDWCLCSTRCRPCRRAWSGYIGDRDAGRDSCGPEVAAHTVADLDRRLGQIDSTIEESAKRGRATSALTAIEALRKTREAFAARRQLEGKALADLKAERFASSAKIRQIESEDTPIRYVAELLGADGDIERAIRWLILVMVLCCDPLAIALTAAVASAPQ